MGRTWIARRKRRTDSTWQADLEWKQQPDTVSFDLKLTISYTLWINKCCFGVPWNAAMTSHGIRKVFNFVSLYKDNIPLPYDPDSY